LGDHDQVRALDLDDVGTRPLAMERTTSVPAALSAVATTAHDGNDFQAGSADGSLNAAAATGRWVAASTAACSGGGRRP
jgi:hypothetical protein